MVARACIPRFRFELRRAFIGERTNVKEMKKQGEKCQDRDENERGQWKKGWPKSQKCQGWRKGITRKRTAFKAWDCGEICGGEDRGVPWLVFQGWQSTQNLDWVGPTHPKKGVRGRRGGGGAEKKVRGQTARDKRGEHARQAADKDNRAGVQGHKPRRKGVRTVQNGLVGVDLLGGQRLPASGGRKKGNIKKWEVPDTSECQETEIYSNPLWDRQVLHCSTLVSPKKTKSWLGTGLGRALKKKRQRTYQRMPNFGLSCTLHSPLSKTPPTIG